MRPLLYFDLETTGTNIARDRIIDLAVVIEDGAELAEAFFRFNPGIPIPAEASAVHGITSELVEHSPLFEAGAHRIIDLFKGRDLAGYNIANFDVPILWEEFNRCGIHWDLTGINIIDACTIFRIKEERTLDSAMRFYCGVKHDMAHSSMHDVLATRRVLAKQRERYADLGAMDHLQLARFCGTHNRVDLAGKIIRNKDGVAVYGFGKSKDVPVLKDRDYGAWMLRSDFSEQTKGVLQRLLNGSLK